MFARQELVGKMNPLFDKGLFKFSFLKLDKQTYKIIALRSLNNRLHAGFYLSPNMPKVIFQDLGRISYQEAWDYQTKLQQELVARKQANLLAAKEGHPTEPLVHYLLFCEHNPVYTLGKSGSADHLLLSEAALQTQGFEFFRINRGGDITYHGPGQIVGYPIFDLSDFFTDVHRYVRYLEEAVMRTLQDYGLESIRVPAYTGVWLPQTAPHQPLRKICAIGVHLSRWVSMHGFAFNINTQLDHFNHIVPCGIADADKAVTSLQQELGHEIDLAEVKEKLRQHFAQLFEFEFVTQ